MFTTLLLMATVSYTPPDFDSVDKLALSIITTESVFDIMQTNSALNAGRWDERDPFLGKHPDAARLWMSGLLINGLIILAAKAMPNVPRKIFELLVLAVETVNISNNIASTKQVYTWRQTMSVSFW